MMFSFVFLGGITLILNIITAMDWFARRKDRDSNNRAA